MENMHMMIHYMIHSLYQSFPYIKVFLISKFSLYQSFPYIKVCYKQVSPQIYNNNVCRIWHVPWIVYIVENENNNETGSYKLLNQARVEIKFAIK